MSGREARMEFEAGRLPPERLLDLLERQERLTKHLQAEIERLKQRLAPYEPEAGAATPSQPADGPPPSASYSVEAEERRRRRGHPRRKPSPGRRPTELKFSQAHTFEDVYADGVPPADCQVLRARAIWRLRDGRAVLVGYRLFGRPGSPEPSIPGVTPRCE